MDYATERVNHTAGQVVKAFLDHGKNKMKSLHEDDSRKSLLFYQLLLLAILNSLVFI